MAHTAAQCNDSLTRDRVSFPAGVLAGQLGQLNTLALTFAAILVIITGYLQGQLQKHFLHGLQDNSGHTLRFGCQLAQVNDTRHRKPCTLGPSF